MANEKRLVDANVLIRDLTAMKSVYDAIALDGMIKALKDAPTADSVEVVRCEDCKWYAPNNGGSWLGCAFDTRHPDDVPKAEDFCSYGERKDGDGNEVD